MEDFDKKYTEGKNCKSIRSLRRHHDNRTKYQINEKDFMKKDKKYRKKVIDIFILKKKMEHILN